MSKTLAQMMGEANAKDRERDAKLAEEYVQFLAQRGAATWPGDTREERARRLARAMAEARRLRQLATVTP